MANSIERIDTRVIYIPYEKPVKHPYLGARTKNSVLIVEVRTSDGCTGLSFVSIESAEQIAAINLIIKGLEPALKGVDPLRREYIYDRMWGLTVDMLHDGASNLALAAVDIALWDILGKQAQMPLWKLLGGFRAQVPAYAAETLWRHQNAREVAEEGAMLVKRGHRAMKLRTGGRPVAEDVERARALREAVGPDVTLMTDVLWGCQPAEAIALSNGIAPYNFAWFEEPLREGDFEGLRRVRDRTSIPLAAGERVSRVRMIEQLIPVIDHAIIDLHHIGGITPWLKVAAALGARGLPISGHATHEINCQLVAAVPTGAWVEYMPRRETIFKVRPELKDGMVHLSDAPGIGLELDEKEVARYAAGV
jgi:L-alanine-DL-glutamate epimerase-like enolase superfamily enzyme